MDSAVILLSGGMDSATLLFYVKKRLAVPEIRTLSFRYGQKHVRELEMARRQADAAGALEHRQIDWTWFGELAGSRSALTAAGVRVPDLAEIPPGERGRPATYVPNRNMVFLAVAAAYAEAQGCADVFYGAQQQDACGYWDCSPEFVRKMNETLGINRDRPVRIHAPFAAMRKAEVARLGLELGVDYTKTWSCYRGGELPCGTCPSCVERDKALREAASAPPARRKEA